MRVLLGLTNGSNRVTGPRVLKNAKRTFFLSRRVSEADAEYETVVKKLHHAELSEETLLGNKDVHMTLLKSN